MVCVAVVASLFEPGSRSSKFSFRSGRGAMPEPGQAVWLPVASHPHPLPIPFHPLRSLLRGAHPCPPSEATLALLRLKAA